MGHFGIPHSTKKIILLTDERLHKGDAQIPSSMYNKLIKKTVLTPPTVSH